MDACTPIVVQTTPPATPVLQVVQQTALQQQVVVPSLVQDVTVQSVVEQPTANALEQYPAAADTVTQYVGPPGPPGATGPQGPPGPTGAAGSGGDKTFPYAQPTASASWLIAHGLGKYPSVSVVDSAGSQIFGAVNYLDLNTVRIDFSLPFSGSAFLN